MPTESLNALALKPEHWYVDATFGGGGHTAALLAEGVRVIAFDFDQAAITAGEARFASEIADGKLILVRENFDHLEKVITELVANGRITQPSGVLFDFGTSTEQLTSTERGFSLFGTNDELDMRLDERLGVKAKDLLMVLSEKQLQQVFSDYGGEENARSIARAIVKIRLTREGKQLGTVGGLVDLITRVKRGAHRSHLHPATKVFQALRIAVNDELGNIERALPQALRVLALGGRLVTIAFHEGEDRIVKNYARQWESTGKVIDHARHPLSPSEEERTANPRSRSAKLRVLEKTV